MGFAALNSVLLAKALRASAGVTAVGHLLDAATPVAPEKYGRASPSIVAVISSM
jgi:hypothetical protein